MANLSRSGMTSLFCARVDLPGPDGGPEPRESLERLVSAGIGGLILFGGDRERTPRLLADLRDGRERPPFIMADVETGVAAQVSGCTSFPGMMALGAAGSTDLARRIGRATAIEAAAVGIDVILGPVLDVNSNALNPIIGTRAFGDDPEAVGELGNAYIQGVQETGSAACAKHFPGHGDTHGDSHAELPLILRGPESLRGLELPPFARAVEAGVQTVMVAHVALPNVTGGERIPASLSRRIVGRILRDDLGFEGLVLTDAMNMEGVRRGTDGEAGSVVRALRAGVDMILCPVDLDGAIRAVRSALERGGLEESRLTEACGRVGRLRTRLHDRDRGALSVVACRDHRDLAREAAETASTLVRNRGGFFPLLDSGTGGPDGAPGASNRVALLVYRDDEAAAGDGFASDLRNRFMGADVATVGPAGAGFGEDRRARMSAAGRLLVFVFSPIRAWRGVADLSPEGREFLDGLLRQCARPGLVSFGSPNLVRHFPWVDAYLCLYGAGEAERAAALRVIAGERPPGGRLPVTIPGLYPRGHGITLAGSESGA